MLQIVYCLCIPYLRHYAALAISLPYNHPSNLPYLLRLTKYLILPTQTPDTSSKLYITRVSSRLAGLAI
jgi:hypothetical protein